METATVRLPVLDRSEVIVPAPDDATGNWAGAARAVLVDGEVYLAYRVRRPLGVGRGVATVVARSRHGVRLEQVSVVAPGAEDRMSTAYFPSRDGLTWQRQGTVLSPTPGAWDARGARVTDVLSIDSLLVLYDGRRRAADNWHEITGAARGLTSGLPSLVLVADDTEPLRSPHSDGACRYVTSVTMPDGTRRFYLEMARPDGAHDLVTATS